MKLSCPGCSSVVYRSLREQPVSVCIPIRVKEEQSDHSSGQVNSHETYNYIRVRQGLSPRVIITVSECRGVPFNSTVCVGRTGSKLHTSERWTILLTSSWTHPPSVPSVETTCYSLRGLPMPATGLREKAEWWNWSLYQPRTRMEYNSVIES